MHIQHILKRDGRVAEFDRDKIAQAMAAAGNSTGELDLAGAQALTDTVIAALEGNPCPGVETIQNRVEEALVQAGHWRTARAYIVHREQHARLRALRHTLVDVESAMEEYLDQRDWRVNANANQGYSLGGLILNVAGKVTANYWLSNVFAPEAGRAHREGDIHIHDLDMLSGYCAGWSLRQLLTEGFNGIPGKVEATPPRHMSAAIGQIVNFLGTLQNEWAGAQAFSSFDTYMAPFIRRDAMTYADVKQSMQELIYNLNVPSRWGTQTPFTNLTFDWTCPPDLKDQIPYIGGEEMPFSYGDLQTEMDMINRAYIEVMMAGDAKGRVFTFPIPTYNITPDFDWDHPNTERLFEMTARYGLPYFQNFLNSDLEPHMVRSMCCRLQLDLRELLKRGNGLFGSAEQTGSVGVVTVNCARLGYTCRGDEARLMQRLDHLLELGRDVLETKRKVVQRYIDQGLYPYTRRYLGTLRNHFSTLGVNGINEMVRNFTADAEDITTAAGHALAVRLLDRVRDRMTEFQEETGHLYNLEATPAEGTTYRFAREDRKRYPAILQAGSETQPYYTNSSQLPVGHTDDPFHALELQETLQGKYTGGTVLHLYMNEAVSSSAACKQLVRRALSNFRLPYITVTPTFSICPNHGYLAGHHEFCPKCDAELLAKQAACCTPA
ncbi:ribonucleoside triphosphate reductase [Achromobacter sp. ACM04]|jgi:ribonucleoside-triphosphate reductase|uniref:Anaerobic ribonucleoside-triphosphate reductase n=1 Tax=Achromobacter aegrifaciens TaxID=1287736 RepID=A0AAD2J2Z2_ACHAE|nr:MULTISPECIES: ribonucleoside triphosphate reductase [Achromobacter]PTN52821.1 ribonucleoside triphosphate reductase [Achromobacter xylosoxidans]MBD9418332.1 ribonucleoside triphosphate reductase [Achromobacter sp. ACM04]MBD9473405.1 ribonucleoside triphosphate reductase [Achromobacter sp. ACM01]MDQ1760071.1 ribonucleoside triphosphate reductase [Achromobacter aegrifaciens]MDR7947059.1 ribonucleoside triphosphate reductase [Achromobacter aegrifaciens]